MLRCPHKDLTQKELKRQLHYNPKTGIFKWIISKRGLSSKKMCGWKREDGYMIIGVNYKRYYAHRLAWLYVYGEFPKKQIDHINRNKTDNRIENIRDASPSTNNKNKPLQKNNKSGYKGIYWDTHRNKWVAQIKLNGKQKNLGGFKNIKNAINARKEANVKYNFNKLD